MSLADRLTGGWLS